MSSSELDDFNLNLDRLVRLFALVLDSGKLDQSTFVGSSYNQSDLTYDTSTATYEGVLTQFANANASFNGLIASATAGVSNLVTASAQFGELVASADSGVQNIVSASATLGGLDSVATSSVSNVVSANASLGELSSNATTTVTNNVIGQSNLGELNSSTTSIVIHSAIFQSILGELSANATTKPTILPIFDAAFGQLVSNANATVIKPEPPEPVRPYGYGAFKRYEKPEPIKPEPLPKPMKVKITKTEPARPVKVPTNIIALADPIEIDAEIKAKSIIEWSILEDEAELLLLL